MKLLIVLALVSASFAQQIDRVTNLRRWSGHKLIQ